MKKRKVLVSILCAAAMLGVSTTALTSCRKTDDSDQKEEQKYTVTFESNGGSAVQSIADVANDSVINEPAAPTKEGFTFEGWYKDVGLTEKFEFSTDKITANTTLYAKWTANAVVTEYTVSFNLDGGTGDAPSQKIKKGEKATKPADPTKEGSTFKGWFNGNVEFDFANTPITGDVALKAVWDVNTLKVTLNLDGGSFAEELEYVNVLYNTTVELTAEPTKAGYDFVGWYVGDEAFDLKTPVTKDLELKAHWEIHQYKVTFDEDNGSENKTELVKYNWTVSKPTQDPTKEGFRFAEWVDAAGNAYDFDTPITADITLKATYVAQLKVTFDLDGGTSEDIKDIYVDGNAVLTKPEVDPVKEGFRFDKWVDAQGSEFDFATPVTDNVTIKATWVETVKITYDLDGGEGLENLVVTLDKGNVLIAPTEMITKKGNRFDRWVDADGNDFIFGVAVNADVTVKATWIETVTVTFDLDGGTSAAALVRTIDKGTCISAPVDSVTKEGYDFMGWTVDGQAYDFDTPVNNDITIKANWELHGFTLTLDVNGHGSLDESQRIVKATKMPDNLPHLSNVEGWIFLGWCTDEAGENPIVAGSKLTDDMTLYAHWSEVVAGAHTITYVTERGTLASDKLENVGQIPAKLPQLSVPAWQFLGWFEDEGRTVPATPGKVLEADITLYAGWEAVYYTVTYVTGQDGVTRNPVNDGEAKDTQVITEEMLAPLDDITGWTFEGWYTNEAKTAPAVVGELITHEMTLYANWTPVEVEKYSVVYHINGHGTEPENLTEQTNLPDSLPELKEEGWKFEGWFMDENYQTEAVAGSSLTGNVDLYAKWTELTAYEKFVAKDGILYSSDFTDVEEQIIDMNAGDSDSNALNTWIGAVSNSNQFSETNGLAIREGKLVLDDGGSETTNAYLNVEPIYSSVVEIEGSITPVVLGSKYTLFMLKAAEFGTVFDLRTGGDIASTDAGKLYYRVLGANGQLSAIQGDGLPIVENQALHMKFTLDLANYTMKAELSQGANSIVYEVQGPNTYELIGMPLTFKGIQLTTSGKNARPIEIDWLGIRIASENVEALRTLMLDFIKKQYDEYNTPEYSQSLEAVNQIYNDGVDAINAAQTNQELLELIVGIDFSSIHSDAELEALAYAQEKIEALETLRNEQQGNYTITKDNEADYFANKEDFDNLFNWAIEALTNCTDKMTIDNDYNNVVQTLENGGIRTDAQVLEDLRFEAFNQISIYFESYDSENPKPTYLYYLDRPYGETDPKCIRDLLNNVPTALEALTTKADILAAIDTNIQEIAGMFPTDEEVLTDIINEKTAFVNTYGDETIATWEGAEYDEVKRLIADDKTLVTGEIAAVQAKLTNNINELVSEIDGYVAEATTEIDRLISTAGKSIEEQQSHARQELRTYIDDKIAANSLESADADRLNAVYDLTYNDQVDPVVNEWATLQTTEAIKTYLNDKEAEVDAIVEEILYERSKADYVSALQSNLDSIKNDTQSNAVKADLDAIYNTYLVQIQDATLGTDLQAIVDEAATAYGNIIAEQANRVFTVTYDNADGSMDVLYGQTIDSSRIAVTGMIVTAVLYNDEAFTGEVYDDMVVHLELAEDPNFNADPVNYRPTTDAFAGEDNRLFTIGKDGITTVYGADATKFAGTTISGTTYDPALTMNCTGAGGTTEATPFVITAKDNLKYLKAYLKLAGSNGSDHREGEIFYQVNDNPIVETGAIEYVLEEMDLKANDVVKIWVRNDTKKADGTPTGANFYLAGVDAEVDTTAVPKTITVTWDGLNMEAEKYSHIDTIVAPIDIPAGEGAFQYWYYLDENSEKIQLPEEGIKLSMGTTITFYAEFAQSNVTITYIDGADTEVRPYSVGDGATGVDPKEVVAGENEKFVGWFEDGATTPYDFTAVTAGTTVTVYAKWHDMGKVEAEQSYPYDYSSLSELPTTDSHIEYKFKSGTVITSGEGIYLAADASTASSNYIKITLNGTGKINAIFLNNTGNTRIAYIDTVSGKANPTSSLGHVELTKNGGTTEYKLNSVSLEKGVYYICWTGKQMTLKSVEIIESSSVDMEFSGITGTPVDSYVAGSPCELDLTGLALEAVDGSNSVDLNTVKEKLSIVIENEADFLAGTAGTYNVSITYGKHTKITYTVTVA